MYGRFAVLRKPDQSSDLSLSEPLPEEDEDQVRTLSGSANVRQAASTMDKAASTIGPRFKVVDKPSREPGVHQTYYWVMTDPGHERKDYRAIEVVEHHGVPKRVFLAYVKEELTNEAALKGLPAALMLIMLFALMFVGKDDTKKVHSIEKAIDFDFEENANFAFSSPGYMGHKNLDDVNSFADFWSWMRLGAAPLIFKDLRPVSEDNTMNLGYLGEPLRDYFLWHNRIIGALWMRQETAVVIKCPGDEFTGVPNLPCSKDAPGLNLDVDPEESVVMMAKLIEDPAKTMWIRFPMNASNSSNASSLGVGAVIQQLDALEASLWLDRMTSRIQIAFVHYNAPYAILTITYVHFLFPRSGHIWKELTHRSLLLNIYSSWTVVLWDILFYGQITYIFITELIEITRTVKKVLTERDPSKGCPDLTMEFLTTYLSTWNAVDWLSIFGAYAMLVMLLVVSSWTNNIRSRLPGIDHGDTVCMLTHADSSSCNSTLRSFFTDTETAGELVWIYRKIGGFFPIVIMLRLFKAFSAQPRLALVTQTLSSAFQDVFHFSIVFSSVFATYAIMGTVLFGREVVGFASVDRALATCFEMLFGDFDLEGMKTQGRGITYVYFLSFMIIVSLLMLNMLLAIIMDVYAEVKGKTKSSQTLYSSSTTVMNRWWLNRRGKRVPLQSIVCCIEDQDPDCETSDGILTSELLLKTVPMLGRDQSMRHLEDSVLRWRAKNHEEESLAMVVTRLDRIESKVSSLAKLVAAREERILALAVSPALTEELPPALREAPCLNREHKVPPDVQEKVGAVAAPGAEAVRPGPGTQLHDSPGAAADHSSPEPPTPGRCDSWLSQETSRSCLDPERDLNGHSSAVQEQAGRNDWSASYARVPTRVLQDGVIKDGRSEIEL